MEKRPIANREEKIAYMKSHNETLGSIINTYEKIDVVVKKAIAGPLMTSGMMSRLWAPKI